MKHIILIGFKNVGKTLIAKNLALALDLPFVDSDIVLEDLYANEHEECLSCREIKSWMAGRNQGPAWKWD